MLAKPCQVRETAEEVDPRSCLKEAFVMTKKSKHSKQKKIYKLAHKGSTMRKLRRRGREILLEVVDEVVENALAHPEKYFANPEKDFTRERKMTLPVFVSLMFRCYESNINDMISRAFEKLSPGTDPTRQSFIDARGKVSYLLFEDIFREFTFRMEQLIYDSELYTRPLYHESSGTHEKFKIFFFFFSNFKGQADPTAEDAYHVRKNGSREYNLYHLNAMYNVMSGVFVRCMIKGKLKDSERYALLKMVEQMPEELKKEAIILADRGYPAFEIFRQLIESGVYFIMRTIAPDKNGSTLKNMDLPKDKEFFDETKSFILKKYKGEISQTYPDGMRWKIDEKADSSTPVKNRIGMTLRIVKVKVEKTIFGNSASERATDEEAIKSSEQTDEEIEEKENKKEKAKKPGKKEESKYVDVYLVTNIPRDVMTGEEIAQLYTKRWCIETAFGQLKRYLNGKKFHSIKHERIYQELWARLTLFNYISGTSSFFEMVKARVYEQKTNFRYMADACLKLLWKGESYNKFEYDACRDPVKIRPGRHFERKMGNNNSKPQYKKPKEKQEQAGKEAA